MILCPRWPRQVASGHPHPRLAKDVAHMVVGGLGEFAGQRDSRAGGQHLREGLPYVGSLNRFDSGHLLIA